MNRHLRPGDNVVRGQDMDRHIPDRIDAAVVSIVAALGLAGCDSVFTIHSIAAAGDGPSAVPDISGLWVPSDPQLAGLVLRIAAEDHDIGRCRNVDIHVLSAYTSEEIPIGDQICFVPVAGHLVAQLRASGQVQFYQQALFKFDQQSISFCEEIWTDLRKWSEKHPKASAAHGLEFVGREREVWIFFDTVTVTDLFVSSSPNAILEYFESRLPEVPKACDELDEQGRSAWITYTRLTPPRPHETADEADTLPLPKD